MFAESYQEMVLVKDIEIYSLCEHHLLPFFGKAHIAYIPDGTIVGLSKIPRVVDVFARRLQVQERLTIEIRDCIQETLKPLGVAVVIECQHLCMQMRGVSKQNSLTTTSAFSGEFLHNDKTRKEFIHLIGNKLK
jgi:GTP cyclohydrolase I